MREVYLYLTVNLCFFLLVTLIDLFFSEISTFDPKSSKSLQVNKTSLTKGALVKVMVS